MDLRQRGAPHDIAPGLGRRFISSAAAGPVLLAACLSVSCAAVERVAAEDAAAVASRALKAVVEQVGPLWRKGAAAAEETLARQAVSWTLKSEQRVVFKAFGAVHPRTRWRRVVRFDVKRFVQAFEEGARDPERFFNDPSADRALIARWKATPQQDRVFVAGAQQDTPLIEGLRTQLEKEGKTVFFYRFCGATPGALCASTTVGAFFSTAGAAVLATTEASSGSRFVPHEVSAGVRVLAGETELLLLTPDEALANIGSTSGLRMVEAIVPPAQSSS